jgi:hypothetical protein
MIGHGWMYHGCAENLVDYQRQLSRTIVICWAQLLGGEPNRFCCRRL